MSSENNSTKFEDLRNMTLQDLLDGGHLVSICKFGFSSKDDAEEAYKGLTGVEEVVTWASVTENEGETLRSVKWVSEKDWMTDKTGVSVSYYHD